MQKQEVPGFTTSEGIRVLLGLVLVFLGARARRFQRAASEFRGTEVEA